MKPSEFLYCSKCNREIAPSKCITDLVRKKDEICTNWLTGGYLDEYEYKNVIDKYIVKKCPRCKKELQKLYLGYDE